MLLFLLVIFVVILGGYIYYVKFLAKKFDPGLRAQEFLKNNQLREAVYEYRKLIDENPYDFISHFRLANIHLTLKELDEAEDHFQKVLDINKFNYEVDKSIVEKNLMKIYSHRGDAENTFRVASDLHRLHPADEEALYHCAFLSLGQEEYDISQRYFERLLKLRSADFDCAFGAGMCYYQNQKTSEAIAMFRAALEKNPESDIANLSMAFAQRRKRDYKKALSCIEKLAGMSSDPDVLFFVMRFEAILYAYLKRSRESVAKFESLLNYVRKSSMLEEELITLYDLGFASILDEQTTKAYEYWNMLAEKDRNYKGVQPLIMQLRREMSDENLKNPSSDPISGKTTDWLENSFSPDFLWETCGLKADYRFDIRQYVSPVRGEGGREDESAVSFDEDYIPSFCSVDGEKFRMVTARVLEKMGFKVQEFLTTYKESDGVDILASERSTGDKVYVWVRRWKQTKIGEIPLRNFAQSVNDNKAKMGIFITTAQLTDGAAAVAERLNKVRFVFSDELNKFLNGIMQ